MNRFTRIASLFAVIAAFGLLPTAAQALDNNTTPGNSGGCTYTDADGYDIPIDEGQTVFVDGKLVTCKDGTIVITTAPNSVKPGSAKPTKVTAGKFADKLTSSERAKLSRLQKAVVKHLRDAGISTSSTAYRGIKAGSNSDLTTKQCQALWDAANKLDQVASDTPQLTGRQEHAMRSVAKSVRHTFDAVGCQNT